MGFFTDQNCAVAEVGKLWSKEQFSERIIESFIQYNFATAILARKPNILRFLQSKAIEKNSILKCFVIWVFYDAHHTEWLVYNNVSLLSGLMSSPVLITEGGCDRWNQQNQLSVRKRWISVITSLTRSWRQFSFAHRVLYGWPTNIRHTSLRRSVRTSGVI